MYTSTLCILCRKLYVLIRYTSLCAMVILYHLNEYLMKYLYLVSLGCKNYEMFCCQWWTCHYDVIMTVFLLSTNTLKKCTYKKVVIFLCACTSSNYAWWCMVYVTQKKKNLEKKKIIIITISHGHHLAVRVFLLRLGMPISYQPTHCYGTRVTYHT